MAKRGNFGEEVSEKDKKKVNKEGLLKTLKIFKFTLPYKGTFLIGFVFLVLSQITSMSVPLLMGQMVGTIVGKKNTTDLAQNLSGGNNNLMVSKFQNLFHQGPNLTLNEVSVLFIIILVFQAIFSFLRVYTFSQVAEKSMRDLRQKLYSKIITQPISFFENNRVGELMSVISSDITQLQVVLSGTLAEFFRQIFTLVGGVILITYLSGKLTVFMLSTFPFLVVAAILFGRFIRKNSRKVQEELGQTNNIVEETFQSINVVKSFTNEQFEVNRYKASTQRVLNFALKAATLRGGFISFVIFVLFGGIVGVVWYGGSLVLNGSLAFKDLFTFIIYTGFIGGSVGGLGDMYAQIQRTVGSSERILEILDEKSEVKLDQKPSLSPALAVNGTVPNNGSQQAKISYRNVVFTYPARPEMTILKNLSFEVKSGEKIALVGQSGAGKSTIVQLLMKYYPINRGEIWVDGKNIAKEDVTELRQKIAIVPQEVILFGGTIFENIAYGKPNATPAEVVEAARRANALDFIESFPDKFQTIVGDRGVKLSGGQRQRIAIARAILKNPAILILDEATSSLDAGSEKLVQDALDELMKNRTTIIIAHRLATVRNVDCIYVLKDGEIVESGTHEELMLKDSTAENGGIYANLVKLQFDQSVLMEN